MGTNLQRRSLGDNFDQRLVVTSGHFLTTSDNKFIMAAGFWDKSFRVFTADTGRWRLTWHISELSSKDLFIDRSGIFDLFQVQIPLNVLLN
jgi:hypothetical protein